MKFRLFSRAEGHQGKSHASAMRLAEFGLEGRANNALPFIHSLAHHLKTITSIIVIFLSVWCFGCVYVPVLCMYLVPVEGKRLCWVP